MWSRIASIVDDLNFDDDDGSDDSSFSNEEKEQSRIDMELKSTQEELAKYKEKVIQLREELRDSESNAQDLNREFSQLVQSKEQEIASLKQSVETLTKENNDLKQKSGGSENEIERKVLEVRQEMQKEIDLLKTQLADKDQQYKDQLDQQNKETNALKEKLVRVESNLQQVHSECSSPSSSLPSEIITWLQSLSTSLHSLNTSNSISSPLPPPPATSLSDLYLCLENLYTEYQSITDNLSSLQNRFNEQSSFYQHLRSSIISLFHLSSTCTNEDLEASLLQGSQKCDDYSRLQIDLSSLQTKYNELQTSFTKEHDQMAASLNNSERRCESLKSDLRQYLRKEQEYEDRVNYLVKENQRLTEEVHNNEKEKLEEIIQSYQKSIKEKEREIESLSIQIATYKTENDNLLTERIKYQDDIRNSEQLKQENERNAIQIQSLESTISTLTDQVELAEKEVQRISIQYKNSQEDLNFAQMCVKNLQASLAVYSSTTTKEEEKEEEKKKEEKKEEEEEEKKETTVISICNECKEKEEEISKLTHHVSIMDEELCKLRQLVIEEQAKNQKQHDEYCIDKRLQRQLLVTYLTSIRGGTALKALMENLNLSEEEQRVCLLKEVEKFSEKEKQSSSGLFAWIGGIAMEESNEPIIPIDTKETVDELWNRLFDYEQSK